MDAIHDIIIITTTQVLELLGVAAILIGVICAFYAFFRDFRHKSGVLHAFRANIGVGILIGLEFLVAADIIWTVGVEPTLYNVAVLALIILLRTFLSMVLSMEVNNWLPWEKDDGSNKK